MYINRDEFYKQYRYEFGRIQSNITVNNINTMLDALEKYQDVLTKKTMLEEMAYIAATVHHETGAKYSAFKEVRQVKTDTARRKEVRRLQDRYWGTGYYGRGPVQLTWKKNYEWAEKATGRPLVQNPDLLLTDLLLGYEVTIKGMAQGAFTGKALKHTIKKGDTFVDDRIIVNGKDQAQLIAGYAKKFFNIFKFSTTL